MALSMCIRRATESKLVLNCTVKKRNILKRNAGFHPTLSRFPSSKVPRE